MKSKILSLLVLSLFIGSLVNAQSNELLQKDSLDIYIHQAMEAWKIPGVAVCVIKDGEIIFQKGYGVSNRDTKDPVNLQTVFPIASISKTFTGAIYARLEAEGVISLNDLVVDWLPNFQMKDKLYEQQLMLIDILSHRSGWKTFQGDLLNTESSMDFDLMIEKFGQQTPTYPIRSKFGYSNFGFIIAGQAIKNITTQEYTTYLKSRLLDPLGMDRTLVYEEEIKDDKNKAAGHTVLNDSIILLPQDREKPFSHGGIYTSIQDMAFWVKTLLNNGTLDGKSVIPESAITKMWQSHTIIDKRRAADRRKYLNAYGLGWEIMQYQNTEVISHGGAYAGALASIALVPDINLGIIILTNQDAHMLQETLKWQLVDAFLNKKAPNYTLNTIEFQNRQETKGPEVTSEKEEEIENFDIHLNGIIGTYECAYYGKAKIEKVNDQYVLSLEYHPTIQGVFSQYKRDQLTCRYNHPMFGETNFPFVIENGKVESFTLFVDGFIESDGYLFTKIE